MDTEFIHQCDELLIDVSGFGVRFSDVDCSKYEYLSNAIDEDLSTHLIHTDLKNVGSIESFFACTLKVWLENWGYKKSSPNEVENEFKNFLGLEGSSAYSRLTPNEFEKIVHSEYLNAGMTKFLTCQFLENRRITSIFSGNENENFLISNNLKFATLEFL